MAKEEFIHNSGLTIAEFYVVKLLLVAGAGIALAICYHDYIDSGPFWVVCALVGAALIFVSDAHALAIGRDGTRLTFHHLWRQSSLEVATARFLWVSSKGNWLLRERPGAMLIAVGRCPWQLYLVYCDQKNNLADMLDEYQTH